MSEYGASSTGARFGCPNCGGGLRYDIVSKKMICDRCGQLTDLEKLEDRPNQEDTLEVTEYHCPQCGAMVYSTDTSATSFCSFCGSDVILTGKLGKAKRPAKIVPFSVTREACTENYRNYLKHYHLMPGNLKTETTLSHFRPVYVPFWNYHVISRGTAKLIGIKDYTKGQNRYHEEYDLSTEVYIDQDNILYDASTSFEDETAAMLMHTVAKAVPFHSAYLSGFYAQSPDVPAETYTDEAAATAVRHFLDKAAKEFEMDSVEMTGHIRDSFGLPEAQYEEELIMMPVWLLAQRKGRRVLYTAVNGSNGKVVCDIPVSGVRIGAVTAAIAAAVFLIIYSFITIKPIPLMLICGFLLMIIQRLFSHAQTVLNNRRTRAFEPDFSGERPTFSGPAQLQLIKKSSSIAAAPTPEQNRARRTESLWSLLTLIVMIFFYNVTAEKPLIPFLIGKVGGYWPMVGMAAILIAMLVHVIRRAAKGGSGPLLPRIVSCLVCGAGLYFLIMRQPEDLYYYGCASAMLLAAVWELLIVTRGHNEYASRPIPFFEEESA